MVLEETIAAIRPLDESAMEGARHHWDSIAKPLHSLGRLEDMVVQIAGMTGSGNVRVDRKALMIFCADNGVVEEGVTQCGQEVTKAVAENSFRRKRRRGSSAVIRERISFPMISELRRIPVFPAARSPMARKI